MRLCCSSHHKASGKYHQKTPNCACTAWQASKFLQKRKNAINQRLSVTHCSWTQQSSGFISSTSSGSHESICHYLPEEQELGQLSVPRHKHGFGEIYSGKSLRYATPVSVCQHAVYVHYQSTLTGCIYSDLQNTDLEILMCNDELL